MNFKLFITTIMTLCSVCTVLASNLLPAPPNIAAKSYILMEASSGNVLVEFNSRERLAPASLTKIMTSYVAAAEIASGRLGWNDLVPVSITAWKAEGSRMFIREGTDVPVIDLMRGIIVVSGNDSSVAIAEHISGTEPDFAEFMNDHARRIGLEDSNFKNSTGLDEEDHYSTAYDNALLTKHLVTDFPNVYALYAEREYTYNEITQPNRNSLLAKDASVDGVKTGYTEDAGYNLVTSAVRDGLRLITVVLGTESAAKRTNESAKLLAYGFRNYRRHTVIDPAEELNPVRVYFGTKEHVKVKPESALDMIVVRGTEGDIQLESQLDSSIEAPLTLGQRVGSLNVVVGSEVRGSVPLVTIEAIDEVGVFERTWQRVKMMFE